MNLNDYCIEAFIASKNKGFHDKPIEIGTMLMLIVSELGKAIEAHRKNNFIDKDELKYFYEPNSLVMQDMDCRSKNEFIEYFKKHFKDTFEDEIADAFIRLFDLCGKLNIDIEKHIKLKMEYNSRREYKHGKNY